MATENSFNLTKKQRKAYYEWMWKYYDSWHPPYKEDPNIENWALITTTFIREKKFSLNTDKVFKKYFPRFVKYMTPRAKRKGGWPKRENATEVIKEFLARGFVHASDINTNPKKYYVITLIGELAYPKAFDHHQDALEWASKWGINGYTKCPIPN